MKITITTLLSLVFFIIALSSSKIQAQSVTDMFLDSLNKNTALTYRNGYNVDVFFTRNVISLLYSDRGSYNFKWAAIDGLGITNKNRVLLSFSNGTFEYITPASGHSPQTILNQLDYVITDITGHSVRVLGTVISDADQPKNTYNNNSDGDGGSDFLDLLPSILVGALGGLAVYILIILSE